MRVLIVVVMSVALLAGCGSATEASGDWEDWERHSASVYQIQEVDFRDFSSSPVVTLGIEISLPDGFAAGFDPRSNINFHADLNSLDGNLTIDRVSVGATPSFLRYSLDEMDQVSVGDRDYSGYMGIGESGTGGTLGTVVYLAAGQWWVLTAHSEETQWTADDQEMFENVAASIDHG